MDTSYTIDPRKDRKEEIARILKAHPPNQNSLAAKFCNYCNYSTTWINGKCRYCGSGGN